jgi:GntR family transcriptional regulator
MLPFPLELRPGRPVYEQIVFAVKKAVAGGVLRPGDRFPSVRTVSQELGVNPNTVQKAVAELTDAGLLDVRPGQGCFVANRPETAKAEALRALAPLFEGLTVEASQYGLDEADVKKAISDHWPRPRNKKREER